MQMRLETNSAAIINQMLERNLTIDSAVELTGLSRSTLAKVVNADSTISYRTAARLKKAFGVDAVIRILPPRRRVKAKHTPRQSR